MIDLACFADTNQQDTLLADDTVRYFMNLNYSRETQGADCYNNFLFVGRDGKSRIDVYDLEYKQFLCFANLTVPDSSRCHANTINFGNLFYEDEDEFPLLYVSAGYIEHNNDQSESRVYVYRLQRKNYKETTLGFEITLVQTIHFMHASWTECILDNENHAFWIKYYSKGKIHFLKYHTPDPSCKDVYYSPSDGNQIGRFAIDNIKEYKLAQGHYCRDGKIMFVAGNPGTNVPPYFVVIDLEKKKATHIINLSDLGLNNPDNPKDGVWEPENIFFYNGSCYIGYRKFIYQILKYQ